jgi:hypothetical protein
MLSLVIVAIAERTVSTGSHCDGWDELPWVFDENNRPSLLDNKPT